MPRILMIVAPQQFRDEELQVPRERFQQEGWQVDTVSTQTGEGTGMLGAQETFTQTLEHANPLYYDAVVVVGGYGAVEHLWPNEGVQTLCRKVAENRAITAAICVSGVVLANAGLLSGKRATVWDMPETRQAYEQHEVVFTGEPVTVDGRFITANGPEAARAFAEAIVTAVKTNQHSGVLTG